LFQDFPVEIFQFIFHLQAFHAKLREKGNKI